jgi:membrane-bound metal-dependent hydrolase YbcI (DUF457 family)
MWLPGHLAVGLFVCFLALILYVRKGGSLVLGLVYVAFFAVLLDFLHLGEEPRAFSHSFFGATILLALFLLLLVIIQGWRPWLALIAVLAVGSHLLADLFIGSIYPWYPWSMEILQNNVFNTIFDIRVELLVCLLGFVALAFLVARWPKGVSVETLSRKDLLAIVVLLGAFFIFALAQTVYFIVLDIAQNTTFSAVLLSFVFIAVIVASGLILFRSTKSFLERKVIP